MLIKLFIVIVLLGSINGLGTDGIRDWVTNFINDKFKKVNLTKECANLEDEGKIPSAFMPLFQDRTFGYPYFDENTRSITVKPLVTLTRLFGVMQPIKLGSQDYVIAGTARDLLGFFSCFKNYEVIGSSLDIDGHWKNNTGSIKIQLSNLRSSNSVNLADDIWEMIFKVGMRRLIQYLQPGTIVQRLQKELQLGGNKDISETLTVAKAITRIKSWLPQSKKLIDEFVAIFKTNSTLKEKALKFIDFIKQADAHANEVGKRWTQWYNVSVYQRILVTLTMYSKPNNRVRSTYDMGKASVTMSDVKNAILMFLDNRVV